MSNNQSDEPSRGADTAVTWRIDRLRFTTEPLQQGLQAIVGKVVETGRLPGAPAPHQKLADYVEYAQAIVDSTNSVAEAITSLDLMYFAWGLPLFAGERPRSTDLDVRDIQNLITLNNCLPSIDVDAGQYHVSATYHSGKLSLIAALNPRAIEWMFVAAIMVQRGLYHQVTDMLLDRKDRFLEVMNRDRASRSEEAGIDPSIIAFSSTLTRVIVNVVTSLKSLNLGQLGGELAHDGPVPENLDFDQYVTGDPAVYSIVKEAASLGCQFHDEILLIEPTVSELERPMKRSRSDRLPLSKGENVNRLQRIEILRTSPGTSRYNTVNAGPTGRVPHARLVSGLLDLYLSKLIPPGQREKLRTALKQPCYIPFTLEVDLATGIGDILVNDPNPKGFLECPALSTESDLPEPATLERIDDILQLSPIRNIEFLDFSAVAVAKAANWNQVVLTYLVVKGWWWSKHLIRDLPTQLFIPNHNVYFYAMASIGATMLHLEQNSGCGITNNSLFDAIRLLTNLGGTHDALSNEAVVYAAQGPGGTLVHDIIGDNQAEWPKNPYLAYRWLRGKFLGIPEVAMFAHGCEWRKVIPTPHIDNDDNMIGKQPINSSVTIFADSTDGHTLSCAIVNKERKIRVLPFCRVLCGIVLAYIGSDSKCSHSAQDSQTFVAKEDIHSLPWSVIEARYFGNAEVREEDSVLITDVEDSKLFQVMALAVSKECTAIDTKGCLVCAFSRSSHVIKTFPSRDD